MNSTVKIPQSVINSLARAKGDGTKMSIPSGDEIIAHYGISKNEVGDDLIVFESEKVEQVGAAIAFDLAKGKGRAVIDYDPAYPWSVLRYDLKTS